VEECFKHLFFFEYPFSSTCWNVLGISWDTYLDLCSMVILAREVFGSVIFREILILSCWSIWCVRNGIIFYNGVCSLDQWRFGLKRQLQLVSLRVKPILKDKISSWLSSNLL
ncbi:hypothetical protein PVAP13_3NG147902, partial [Panicum virgatum]